MQTFLPYPNFETTAACLDDQRLGKQRVETWQIYQALTRPDYGWQNHPAVKMWRGHSVWLLIYGEAICEAWRSRGFKDTLLDKFKHELRTLDFFSKGSRPNWWNNAAFHESHQSNLCRKAPWYYRDYFPNVNMSLPYVWPQP